LLAVAALDGDVQTAQLDRRRIAKPDVQSLLLKVTVRPDDSFTARYPREMPAGITIRLKDGKSFSHQVDAYPGFPTHPFSWADIEAKFGRLVGERADAGLRKRFRRRCSLESVQVAELMRLIGQVRFRRLGRPLFQ
jgi:2-methylcitrate dehydratase